MWGVIDPGFKCVAFNLLAAAAMADVCIVLRSEGKGTGQIDWVRAAADVLVATEKKLNSPRCQARFSSRRCEWGRRQIRQAIAVASCRCCSTAVQVVECMTRTAGPHTHLALPTSSTPACRSNGLLQLLTAMPQLHECAGLQCSRYFGKPASVNVLEALRRLPGC